MIRWREGTVERVRARWPGAAECDVSLHDLTRHNTAAPEMVEPDQTGRDPATPDQSGRDLAAPDQSGPDVAAPDQTPTDRSAPDKAPPDMAVRQLESETVRALAYTDLVGEPRPGDRVLLNVSALELGLGTGGLALIVAIPDRLPADLPPGLGHIVKARYTPLQTVVLGVDEQQSPHHEVIRAATGIGDMPVIMADLHSALPAILAGLRASDPQIRAAYLMTDGGALPIAFSRTVAGLSKAGWLAGTITVGQAFGGTLEAVNVHTGLLAAAHVLHADVAIVAQGPGNLGTDSPWGFSGVATGEAVNATAALGGRAVAALRVSDADKRERHRGISHHSLTAYGRVAMAPADLPVPMLGGAFGERVLEQARDLASSSSGRLRLREVDTSGLVEALSLCPVQLSTMGRGLDRDPASFVASAAAGRLAAALLAHQP